MDPAAQGEETQRCAKGMKRQSHDVPRAQQPPLRQTTIGAVSKAAGARQGRRGGQPHLPMRPLKSTSKGSRVGMMTEAITWMCVNDPSAGSPTER
jgi:hypothetical protein